MSAEVVVVGGGLAGSAAAIALAQAGRDVLLLERESAPKHKVCGEFLSHEALASLLALGLDVSELGAASINAVRLADAKRVSRAELPFPAKALTRSRLDEALLQRAISVGAKVQRGVRVLSVNRESGAGEGSEWCIALDSGEQIETKQVFIATGKHDLPGHPRPEGVQRDFVGFKMHLRLAPQQTAALQQHIELMVFRGGYAGLTCVEEGIADLGWIVQRSELQRTGGVENLLTAMQQQCPHLAERLRGAERETAKPMAISPIPYGYVRRRSRASEDGLWWLGDQAAVIPSFTGDGMSIALHSGRLAAAMYLTSASSSSYQRTLAAQLRRQVALATILSRGLVWSSSRAAMLLATRAWPGSISLAARWTRISENARLYLT